MSKSPGSIQDLATAIPTDSPAVLRSGPPTLCKSVLRVIEMIEREIVICHCLPTRVFSVLGKKAKKNPQAWRGLGAAWFIGSGKIAKCKREATHSTSRTRKNGNQRDDYSPFTKDTVEHFYLAMLPRTRDKYASEPGSRCVAPKHAVTSDHCASDSSV